MKRKIIGQLKSWKENPERKPLILLGARQLGKTWVMKNSGNRFSSSRDIMWEEIS